MGRREPLRYVIVGAAGAVAQKHIRALAELAAPIVGLCDVDEARGREVARKVPCAFHRTHTVLVREQRPDVVVICTPHPSHASIARDCLQLGAHVLIEKPVAVDIGDADELAELCERGSRMAAVSFAERFRPSVEWSRAFIARGELGRVLRVSATQSFRRDSAYYAESRWRGRWRGEGGGVLMNQAPHLLDGLCYLLGSPQTVYGVASTLRHAIECEDTAHALLHYATGAIGHVAVTTAEGQNDRRVEIVGERAVLEWRGDVLAVRRSGKGAAAMHWAPGSEERHDIVNPPRDELAGHLAVHRDLRAAITEGRKVRCDVQSASASLELANAILLSSARSTPVRLPLDRSEYRAFLRDRQR